MEKSVPHYRLDAIKAVVAAHGMDAFTFVAERGVSALEITGEQACEVIQALERGNFYKSMTTYVDHRIWQDVYHAVCPNGRMAYIKFTLQSGAVVIQFKEL
jgi:motility quorum-sensing regulator/GCU-specific mRNA interferase toxin